MIDARSSNGKTARFERANDGSNPSRATSLTKWSNEDAN